jgi:hypothetical protein
VSDKNMVWVLWLRDREIEREREREREREGEKEWKKGI